MTSILRRKLDAGNFVITAEVCPPKGCDCGEFREKSYNLRKIVDAVNVTDNQGANVRISPLAPAALLLRDGIEPIMQFTCRDRNRLALQSELMAAAALGVTNVLALTGDHISFGDHSGGKPVFDLESVQLLQTIAALNSGRDLSGARLHGSTSFYAGAAAAPAAEPFEITLPKLAKKVAAGASFFQTQAIFSPDCLARFAEAVHPLRAKVIVGILLLKSAGMARYVTNRVPGLKVPVDLINELEDAEHPLDTGVAIARRLVTAARPYCDGVHIMAMGKEELIPDILAGLALDGHQD